MRQYEIRNSYENKYSSIRGNNCWSRIDKYFWNNLSNKCRRIIGCRTRWIERLLGSSSKIWTASMEGSFRTIDWIVQNWDSSQSVSLHQFKYWRKNNQNRANPEGNFHRSKYWHDLQCKFNVLNRLFLLNVKFHILHKRQHCYHQIGDYIKRPKLANTLRQLADDPDPVRLFYNGTITRNLVAEIEERGGIINAQDFNRYE